MYFSLQSNKRCMVVLVIKVPISISSFLGGISKQFLKHLVCFQCQRRVTHGGRTINVKYWVSREGRPSQTTQTLRRKTNDTKWCILQKNQVRCSVFWMRKCKIKRSKGYEWKESKIWPIHLELKKGKYDEICTTSPQGDIRTFNFCREFLEMDESTNKAEAVHFGTIPGNRLITMSCTKIIADVSSSSFKHMKCLQLK